MIDSILTLTKKQLGIDAAYTQFDDDIITHINTVFMTLNQMGIGPSDPFFITDATAVWSSFSSDITKLQMVKTYMALKVRSIFDPPSNSTAMEALKNAIAECEWRLNVAVDPGPKEVSGQ